MGHQRNRATCVICDRPQADCGPLSARGRCQECALSRAEAWQRGLSGNDPEWWRRWREGMAASVGAVLPADPPPDS